MFTKEISYFMVLGIFPGINRYGARRRASGAWMVEEIQFSEKITLEQQHKILSLNILFLNLKNKNIQFLGKKNQNVCTLYHLRK